MLPRARYPLTPPPLPPPSRPAEMFQNKLEVDSITVRDVTKLSANEMVVVYKQLEGKIERRIVKGPTIFIPNAHEWYVWLCFICSCC